MLFFFTYYVEFRFSYRPHINKYNYTQGKIYHTIGAWTWNNDKLENLLTVITHNNVSGITSAPLTHNDRLEKCRRKIVMPHKCTSRWTTCHRIPISHKANSIFINLKVHKQEAHTCYSKFSSI